MGACTFYMEVCGVDANDAFMNAVRQAEYDYGHAGYTGTIAEKHSFIEIELPEGEELYDYAHKLIDKEDPRVDDKWGPAGCIRKSKDTFMFFGWASS